MRAYHWDGRVPTPLPVVLWCNWLALWTLNPAIRVQIPVGPFCRTNPRLPHAKSGHGGDRTHDRRLIRPSLCHLSYATGSYAYTVRGSNSGPPACEAGVIATRPTKHLTMPDSFFEPPFTVGSQLAKNAHRGARTHDHQLKRLALYRLS